jgi:hypothetical protein
MQQKPELVMMMMMMMRRRRRRRRPGWDTKEIHTEF